MGQKIVLGFFVLSINLDGSVTMMSLNGKSFEGYARAVPHHSFKTFQEAYDKAREWSVFIWTHNDQNGLIEEYSLTRETVGQFLGYVWPRAVA